MNKIRKSINTALEFLNEGKSFNIGLLRLSMEELGVLYVTGWSKYNDLDNYNKNLALIELNELKEEFSNMVSISSDIIILKFENHEDNLVK